MFLSGGNSFVFNEDNRLSIHQNIFNLVRMDGFTAEYLYAVPIDIFNYYIKCHNKRMEEQAQAGTNDAQGMDYKSKPIGDVAPRG